MDHGSPEYKCMFQMSLTEPRQPGVSNTGETTTVFVSRHVPSPHT